MSNEEAVETDIIGEALDKAIESIESATRVEVGLPHTSPILHAIPFPSGTSENAFGFKFMTQADFAELRALARGYGIDGWSLPSGWALPSEVEVESCAPAISNPRRKRSEPATARKAARKGRSDDSGYLEKLQDIVDQIRNGTAAYPAVSERYLTLNESLNKRDNVPAPAFRPRIERVWLEKSPAGTDLFIDQQIIDMHWLFCKECEFEPSAGGAFLGLKKDGITASSAREFAARKWEMPAKVAALNATHLKQFGCIWILDRELRKKRRELVRTSNRHLRMLEKRQREGTVAERRSLERIDPYRVASAWLARELARLSGGPSSDAQVANYFRLVTGEPASRSAVGNQLSQVAKHIDAHRYR